MRKLFNPGGFPMLKTLRTFTQTLPDGRTIEMSLLRSDSFLYLMSLTASENEGLWKGELGLLYKPVAGRLMREMHDVLHDFPKHRPYRKEALVVFGGSVERIGLRGELKKELCTDIESVTLFFSGQHVLQEAMHDLEGALSWAA